MAPPHKTFVFTVTRRDLTNDKDKKGVANLLEIHATVDSANDAAVEAAGDPEDETEKTTNKGDGCMLLKNRTENVSVQVKRVELKDNSATNGQGAASAASAVSSTAKSSTTKKTTAKTAKKPAAAKTPVVSKKTTQLEGVPGSLDGVKLIFTGTLSMDRKTCDATAEAHGAEIVAAGKMDEADYVILGTKPGDKKLTEIKEKGLATLTEEEFIEMLNGEGEPPSKKRKF